MKKPKARILFSVGVCVFLTGLLCAAGAFPTFRGNRVINSDSYSLEITRMNGSDSHSLELRQGDVLEIRFETERGTLRMEIQGPDGVPIYSGNGTEAASFTLNIRQTGSYTILVEAKQAQGTIRIIKIQ